MKVEKWRTRTGRKFGLFYVAELGALIITIPKAPHEALNLGLYNEATAKIHEMGLRRNWSDRGSTEFSSGDSFGQPDSCGGPIDRRGRSDDWPTLVVEAGRSQTWPSLHVKKDWWFAASGGKVSSPS